jgi:hypothetical protein
MLSKPEGLIQNFAAAHRPAAITSRVNSVQILHKTMCASCAGTQVQLLKPNRNFQPALQLTILQPSPVG